MRIVVTGGAGFIGSALCRMLVAERGATVLNLDKLTATSSLASLSSIAQSPRYTFRKTDVCEHNRVAALLEAFAPDAILHAAMEPQSSGGSGAVSSAVETNVLGTWRMLEVARDYWERLPERRQEKFRFVSVSSAGTQATPAAAIRAGADELVTAWHKSYGLPTIVSKAAATFGSHQFPREPVPAATIAAIDGMPADTLGSEPGAWLFLDDHVRALLAMLDKGTPGACYTVAGRDGMVPAAMAQRVRELVTRHGPGRSSSNRFAAVSPEGLGKVEPIAVAVPLAGASARLEQDTGWRAQESIESALSSTVRWYLANEAWWRPLAAAQAADEHFGMLRIA